MISPSSSTKASAENIRVLQTFNSLSTGKQREREKKQDVETMFANFIRKLYLTSVFIWVFKFYCLYFCTGNFILKMFGN